MMDIYIVERMIGKAEKRNTTSCCQSETTIKSVKRETKGESFANTKLPIFQYPKRNS